MNDDLSLEKLKINERLHEVEIQVARLVSHMESEQGTFVRIQNNVEHNFQRVMQIIERHEKLFFGDGNAGMLTKIDRQEQVEEGRRWHFRVIWTAIVAMMFKIVHDLFKP